MNYSIVRYTDRPHEASATVGAVFKAFKAVNPPPEFKRGNYAYHLALEWAERESARQDRALLKAY